MKKIASPLFQDLSEAELDTLAAAGHLRTRQFAKHEVIFHAGSCVREIGIVLRGSVHIENLDLWGTKSILSSVGAGQAFAETYALCGDVMMVGDDFYVGCSARSNAAGIQRLSEILAGWGLRCHAVPMAEMLHLKTGVSYLEAGRMLVAGEFVTQPLFAQFQRIPVPAEEAYAANSLWINGTVLVPAGYPATARAVAAAGYDLIQLEMSEFRKLDGGLSCLSLRF
mgnify:CR=1 FL=1